MPYPTGTALVVIGGTLGSGVDAEIWSCSVRGTLAFVGSGEAANAAARTALVNQWAAALQTWFSASTSRMRSDAKLTYVKLNSIAPNGDYLYPASPVTRNLTSTGALSPVIPSVLCVATSWKTARGGRSIGVNGRIYLPNRPNFVVDGGMRVAPADAVLIRDAGLALLGILATDASAPTNGAFTPCVVSKGVGNGVGAGIAEPITGVRVGDVIDVIRNRKDALREVYTAVASFTG